MRHLIQKTKKLLTTHNTKVLYAATLLATGLSFLGSVLNTRLLSQESFGDWKYLQSFIVLVGYLVNFGLYHSGSRLIAATNSNEKIRTYKGYMLYFALLGASVITFTILSTGFFFPKLLNANLFSLALFMFPFFIIHPLGHFFESVYQGEQKILSLAAFRLIPPLVYVLLLYSLQSYSRGSIFYNAVLYYVSIFTVCVVLLWNDRPIFKRGTSEWLDLKAQHKDFGLHLYWGSLWGVGVIYLLPLLVGFFNINNVEVGYYSLALSFIMPISILPTIVGTSNYRKYVTLPAIPRNNFKKVIIACIAMQASLLLGIDYIISSFLGPGYQEVATLIKIGSTGAVLHGLADFVNKFLLAKGEAKYLKKVSIAVGISQLISSLVLIKLFSATGGIIAKTIGSVVFFGSVYVFYHRKYLVGKSEGHRIVIHESDE